MAIKFKATWIFMHEHKLHDKRWLKVADLCVYCMHVCSKLLIFICMVVLHTEFGVHVLCLYPMVDLKISLSCSIHNRNMYEKLQWLEAKQKQYCCQENQGM